MDVKDLVAEIKVDLTQFDFAKPCPLAIGYYITLNDEAVWEMEKGHQVMRAFPPESADEIYAAVIDFNPEHYEMVIEEGSDGMTSVKIKPKA